MTTSDRPNVLRAGGALIDITPNAGTHLGGTWGVLRDARTVAEPLYTRALVLESRTRKLCIVQPDLEIATLPWTQKIRQGIERRCGIAPDDIMVHLPQSHSTPPLGNFVIDEALPNIPPELEYLRGSQSEYCEYAVGKILSCVEAADKALHPVQLGAGRAVRDDLAFNRRGVTRDGGIVMPGQFSRASRPLGPTDIAFLEGPTDPEVGMVCLRDEKMKMSAMLLHFTCHPVNVFATQHHTVSPDWPGVWCAGMQEECGETCVPLVLNGCCGNINPWPAFHADFVPDHRRMGRALAETSRHILSALTFEEEATLDARVKLVPLPLKKADSADRAAAEKLLAEHPEPRWDEDSTPRRVNADWMDAAMLMSVELERERSPELAYEIQVMRIGDIALVGLPGEPFVEGQLEIKVRSPFPYTFVAHNTTDFAGYIAPRHSYPRGGHEIRNKPAKWAKVEPGCLEKIVEEAVRLLDEIGT